MNTVGGNENQYSFGNENVPDLIAIDKDYNRIIVIPVNKNDCHSRE